MCLLPGARRKDRAWPVFSQAQLSPEVALLFSTNDPLGFLLCFVKSLSTVKENGPVLYPHLIDIRLLALDNLPLLALVSSVADDDLISYRKACHNHLPGVSDWLLIRLSGPVAFVPREPLGDSS